VAGQPFPFIDPNDPDAGTKLMWDNMFRILLMNLGYILVLAIAFLLAPLFLTVPALFVATSR
jgi:hypothetical protein